MIPDEDLDQPINAPPRIRSWAALAWLLPCAVALPVLIALTSALLITLAYVIAAADRLVRAL
jgi:hypothetical protein